MAMKTRPGQSAPINLALVEPEQMARYFNKGGVVHELLGISEDELDCIYQAAYHLYDSAPAFDNKTGASADMAQLNRAESLFQLLCTYDHCNSKYFMGLGACRQAKGEFQTAADAYSMGGIIDVDNPLFPYYAAQCHLAMGDLKSAESGFYSASMRFGSDPELKAMSCDAKKQLELVRKKQKEKKEERK